MQRDKIPNLQPHSQNYKVKAVEYLLLVCFLFFVLCSVFYAYVQAQNAQEFVYNSKGRRNPFVPLVSLEGRLLSVVEKEEQEGNLVIEGIIYDKYGQSYAIVNGGVVKIGDEIGGYQVLKIESNKVIFTKDGQPKEVELKEEG